MLFLGRPLSHVSAASFLRTRQVAATCGARRSVAVRGISSVYAEQRPAEVAEACLAALARSCKPIWAPCPTPG